jgi:hypothetical protein
MYYTPEIIHNWDRLVLKGVRSGDSDDMGNIISIDKDSLFLMSGSQLLKYQSHLSRDIMEVMSP